MYKKYVADSFEEYPVIWVALGEQSQEKDTDSSLMLKCVLPIDIVGYTQVDTDVGDTGTLTDALESLIEDIEKCFAASEDIADRDNKFFPRRAIPGAQAWYITSIDPYLDEENNKGVCVLRGVIEYFKEV